MLREPFDKPIRAESIERSQNAYLSFRPVEYGLHMREPKRILIKYSLHLQIGEQTISDKFLYTGCNPAKFFEAEIMELCM